MKFNILKTRLGRLESKIKLELETTSPNINNILNVVKDYEKDNLNTIEKLRKDKIIDSKRINGALKSAIAAHGPITKLLIGSATKRINGALLDNTNKIKESKVSVFEMVRITLEVLGILFVLYTFIK